MFEPGEKVWKLNSGWPVEVEFLGMVNGLARYRLADLESVVQSEELSRDPRALFDVEIGELEDRIAVMVRRRAEWMEPQPT